MSTERSGGRSLFAEIAKRVNNWGRWGDGDELGTLNLIDDAARRRAAAAVRRGVAISLSLPLSAEEGIQLGFIPGRVNPIRTMTSVNSPLSDDPEWICSSEDKVELSMQCATHWDAISHVSYNGRMYNGYPASDVTESGASRCGVQVAKTLISRGVLLDVARAKNLDYLEGGYPLTPDDLHAAIDLAGVRLEPGDVVLIRTGQMRWLKGPGRDLVKYSFPAPGLTMACAEWFHQRDVAAVATDTLALEVYPSEYDDAFLPVHLLHLVEMGMTQGQNWDLDELAADCAGDGVYEFLLDASPLPFTRALGSPVNPVALK
ncbi:MAG TPA: cyclase family protein [Acidimicrobiales bacterium]|nr:cyclase family protein [Acidimicrobiales bacterium]